MCWLKVTGDRLQGTAGRMQREEGKRGKGEEGIRHMTFRPELLTDRALHDKVFDTAARTSFSRQYILELES
jgi:hypothetical protein